MSGHINTIERFTRRGSRRVLLEANGDANWRKENPDSSDLRPTGINKNFRGDVEFRFEPTTAAKYEYVVTLTEQDLRRALALLDKTSSR